MPREVLILSARAPGLADFVDAGAGIAPDLRVRTLEGGAVTEVVDRRGNAVLSVQVPEYVENTAESARLAPWAAVDGPVWWTEAWAPWGPAGEVGIAIARSFAATLGAQVLVEDGS
ncbi:hypothetical protein Csp2054_03340 [Curtobacterium sp. 'Ferrero']|uniref:hypothetical protein n=1 Tax=Curtobacterium sp. 'Ferrero' TaxID=2033654 RepID=UPI000BD6F814|nr:hypothetical protein [Curtobacterium sp. 'Ferrero']PCN49228.1 hypothetical protein Csp2054_03340 [Curtobacterium sp. 'Ferrero']